MTSAVTDPVFSEISGDEVSKPTEIESLCPACEEMDLSRQFVKSEFAGITIPEVELEIPQGSQAGEITNIEGIVFKARNSLEDTQQQRRLENPDQAAKIENVIRNLDDLLNLKTEFTVILDDPSGNSFIENPIPFKTDPNKTVIHYHRTLQQEKLLGLFSDDYKEEASNQFEEENGPAVWESKDEIKNEVLDLKTQCENCFGPVEAHMKVQDIPYFKEVVIMASNCEACGHRSAEVKTATGIADQGIKLNLHITNKEDFVRDILKSETCSVEIPEFQLKCGMAALYGRFTTVEGLLAATKDQLKGSSMTFLGDSADELTRRTMEELFSSFDLAISGDLPVHLILDDPAGNSYIQSYSAPEPDENLTVTYYDRSFEQNEELGLNDMKTENYAEEEQFLDSNVKCP